ncbi:unnamed protein product [Spirodela intermedia]|uniref:Uncharacterized protein n=2 Tax=Spirodela intermedia TaxID=51605 RepID=A0A7I8LMI3_SPIIN|nr:unnamed protein product [Spirodela intermedia]CAA6673771.1 unnamed protein product [Spirodela intermedia]CAA7411010.1 unnamed protein product [Spirodela intermedia]
MKPLDLLGTHKKGLEHTLFSLMKKV